jgi:gliding motility-associated-like protein
MHQRIFYFVLFIGVFSLALNGQGFTVTVNTVEQECLPGNAHVVISGTTVTQTVTIAWSTGHQQVSLINNLVEGDYHVVVTVKEGDSVLVTQDTTVFFHIGKKECPVSISNFFTPNSDGYNDYLFIGRSEYYPNFEFHVFNKWGQKVHGQKKTFTPWDGTWNGIALPDGTYYYIFIYDSANPNHLTKGDVTIMR